MEVNSLGFCGNNSFHGIIFLRATQRCRYWDAVCRCSNGMFSFLSQTLRACSIAQAILSQILEKFREKEFAIFFFSQRVEAGTSTFTANTWR